MSAPAIKLRPYQRDLVERLRQSYRGGHRAPLLQLATGGGKTHVFAEVARGAYQRGNTVLVVAHRRELVAQAGAKLELADVPYGIIAAGSPGGLEHPIQVGSVQTLARRHNSLPSFALLIFDEAHHCRAAQWKRLIEAQPGAKLLGVTATPARLDGKGLGVNAGGPFDDLIVGPPAAALIDGEYLSPARCFVPAQRIDLKGVHVRAGDYVAAELAAVLDTAGITGDDVDQYRRRANHRTAIAFCALVSHAEHVAEAFSNAGYRSACVHGGLAKQERDRLIEGLGNGAIEVLTSCDLISEGLDVPAVGAVILLRPTKSLVLHRQQIGRGMRPAPGKSALIVNDHVGNCIRHGLPELEPEWSLAGVENRSRAVASWECPECGCINMQTATECSNCGYVRPGAEGGGGRREPAAFDGELDQLTLEKLAAAGRLSYREVLAGNLSEAELAAFARHRGYRSSWVKRQLWQQQNLSPDERLSRHAAWVAEREASSP
jgi:DNA repair protein RadD